MPERRFTEVDSRPERARTQPPKRQKKPNGAPYGSSIPSVAPLKSKIRDLTRALEHSERMPADVRVEKERALAGYKQDLENAGREKRKQLMIKRYHMVRFFGESAPTLSILSEETDDTEKQCFSERQKAERYVKRAKKAIEASSPDQPDYKQLQQNLETAKLDVCYTMYYPLTEKYVSLYPRKDENDHSRGHDILEKPEMWEVVKRSMAEGTLDALREGVSTTHLNTGTNKLAIKARAPMPKYNSKSGNSASKSIKAEDMDEESDGGFFEEGSDGRDNSLS